MIYTDDATAYKGLERSHESVNHSVREFVRDMAYTNGLESFWSAFKRGFDCTYHEMSKKHLDRYVGEFAGRFNIRELETIHQMAEIAASMAGKRLRFEDLVADNGLCNGARS